LRKREAADRVLARERHPERAGAGVDAAGTLADGDRGAADGLHRGIEAGDRPGAGVGDPDEPVGDGDARRVAARRDRPADREGGEADVVDLAGGGARDPERARAGGEAERRGVAIPAPLVSATQMRPPP
jgi:hypothetical protein